VDKLPMPLFNFKKTKPPKTPPPQSNGVQSSAPSQPQPSSTPPKTPNTNPITPGLTSIADIIAPEAIDVDFTHLKIGNTYLRTLFVAGYPRFVNANWLSPLINFDHSLDISMFIYPVEGKSILDDLHRKITEMEAEVQSDVKAGKIPDVSTEIKLEDAKDLQTQLAKGAERFFQFGLYITITADSLEQLETITKQVQSTLGALLIITKASALQMEDGLKTTLPTGVDHLVITRNMDTTSLATTFPFTSSELTANEGILYGINEHNESLVIFDRFTLENANSVVFAKSGAGKSLDYNETVLCDKGHGPELNSIGSLVENLIKQQGCQQIDYEMEGVINPGLKVFTFNNQLKGEWAKVTVAARKKSPKKLYRFTTASGRQITTTADHNLITINNGKIEATRSDKIKVGNYLPVPRKITSITSPKNSTNAFLLLKRSRHIYIHNASNIINKHYQQLKSTTINPKYDRYLYKYAQGRPLPIIHFNQILKQLNISTNHPLLNKALLGSRLLKQNNTIPLKLTYSLQLHKIMGYYLAEGGITKSHIHISQQNPQIRKDIQKNLRKLKIAHFATKSSINIGTRVFVELIRSLRIGSSAATKKLPSFIFTQPQQNKAALIQTYFEGDGTINEHSISAVSKSKKLISQLSYLLLFFGIISRIKKVFKKATNSNHQGDYYYELTISGASNISRFSKHINFISSNKINRLNKIAGKKENTNVDIVPSLESTFLDIYNQLYSHSLIKSPISLSPLKRGIFNPSQKQLKKIISQFEQRIEQIEYMPKNGFRCISKLPELNYLRHKISSDKALNKQAWKELGQSWRTIKAKKVSPGAKNVLRLLKTVEGYTHSLPTVKQEVHHSFIAIGESLQGFDHSLWSSITQRPKGDTSYQRLINAKNFLLQKHKEKLINIKLIKEKVHLLKKLANSNLFWDPITKIQKLTSQHKYVYDLTVDNEVFLAGHGGMFVHNSYMVKLEALRSLMFGTEVITIDPENEYQQLCEAVGGEYISFDFSSKAKINPFDLSAVYEEGENELGQKIISLHSLLKVMLGKMTAPQEALLDRALVATYKAKGITPDPATQKYEPPLMEDLYKTLIGMETKEALDIASRLEKYVKGSFRGIFDQRTNINLQNQFTVFSIKELEDELRPIAMFIILDYIWTRIKKKLKKRLLIVDEAWYLMKYPDTANFIYSIAKRARKYYLGLTTITQDVEDFLHSDHGKAIVTNSSIQILMKQSTAAIEEVAKTFYLSQGERHLLLAADVGEGLFFAGNNHVAIRVVASPDEHKLITTKPQEILERKPQPQPKPKPTPSPTPKQKPAFTTEEISNSNPSVPSPA